MIMKKRGKFIVFMGPVGVGKSTIVRCLSQTLKMRGLRVLVTFIKSYHGLSYVMWSFVAKLVKAPKGYAPWYSIPTLLGLKRVARVLATLSAYCDAMLFLPIKLAVITLVKRLGFYAISEEFLTVTFLDYLISQKDLGTVAKFPLKVLYVSSIRFKPDLTFFLDAELNVLAKRWFIRGYGDPQERYINLEKTIIPRICRELEYTYIAIDTSRKKLREIIEIVESQL
jgi:deoxyadenosine/deoxycytidine kinase